MFRSLTYHWRMNMAVLLAAAVTTAVITGALLVGDSVRQSLREMTLERLGRLDEALISPRFFRQTLIDDLTQQPGYAENFELAEPALILRGAAVHSTSLARASNVNIYGVTEGFNRFFHRPLRFAREQGQYFPPVVINETLQRELNAQPGDQILIHLERESEIHRESLMGDRDPSAMLQTVRLTLSEVLPDSEMGRFSLQASQSIPYNCFVELPVLQQALKQDGHINVILAAARQERSLEAAHSAMTAALSGAFHLQDAGLRIVPGDGFFSLESRDFILSPWIVDAAQEVSRQRSFRVQKALTYLANRIEAEGRFIPYSTISAVESPPPGQDPFPNLTLLDGSPAPILADDEIFLNEWAASDLQVSGGETVEISYYEVAARDELQTQKATFQLRGVVRMEGLAADSTLTPEFPGIYDAEDMASWNPPFPVELDWIRPKDEEYWDRYKAIPKALISEAAGKRLWSSRFGDVTSLRVATDSDMPMPRLRQELESGLLERISPATAGYIFQPVKLQGLEASNGPTDFSGLFIGFSSFLIISSTLLVGLLFRLGIERRAREIGSLLAMGFRRRLVLWRFLGEGLVLAGVGGLLGLAGAVLYAWLLMVALRTWWIAAVGTSFLFFHLTWTSLVIGYTIALLIVVLSIWLALRKLVALPNPLLLAGATATWRERSRVGWSRRIGLGSLLLATLVMAAAVLPALTDSEASYSFLAPSISFFLTGALLLVAGLSFFAVWCRKSAQSKVRLLGGSGLLSMAIHNSARNPGRSVLSVTLVASACFVIVAVAANRFQEPGNLDSRESGSGGFSLVAESDISILQNLQTSAGRLDLGIPGEEAETLKSSAIFPFRLLPGDDTSCLNLYAPQKPRILGVPDDFIARGGFRFEETIEDRSDPWTLLRDELEPNVIPAFGDYESVLWILQLGLGKDLIIVDERGQQVRLRLVGLIQHSIFQSEILISEENFVSHFPNRMGYSYFLIDTPANQMSNVTATLEDSLAQFGFDAVSTEDKLAGFNAVRSTYLSTFQILGGLGLILGTLGLAIILIRSVIERRGELATLRAFGFRRAMLAQLVVLENGFLLLLGILIGTVSALVSVAPHLMGGAAGVAWLSLLVILALVVLVGMLASIGAVFASFRVSMLSALRAD